MSYCLFTRTDTKGGREDKGAFVTMCAHENVPLQLCLCECNDIFMKVWGQNQTSERDMQCDY